jgi:hypothetical protein
LGFVVSTTHKEKKMEKDTLISHQSEAYEMGYYAGYSQVKARPEYFPGQQCEYLQGYRKGWLDSQRKPPFIPPFISEISRNFKDG